MLKKLNIRRTSAAALSLLFAGVQIANAGNLPAGGTATPIQHVIVVMGENRSFDHVFATYVPKNGQSVMNLLSEGIIKADGTPGALFSLSKQYTAPAQSSYYIGASNKTAYGTLPAPQLLGSPNVQNALSNPSANPFPPYYPQALAAFEAQIQAGFGIPLEPGIPASSLTLLTTGVTGLASTTGVDTRVTNASNLPNGPFQLTGSSLPYDAYTGDPTHRFFQNWQQSDCSIRNATQSNPSGCLHDLFPYVMTNNGSGAGASEGGTSMAFLNVQKGDAPYLKSLADTYALSDNYHQAQMGGTMVEHFYLTMADNVYYSDGNGNAIAPTSGLIANPNPVTGSNNQYTNDGAYTNCSDAAQPGVAPIVSYLGSLSWRPKPNCDASKYYVINNVCPAYNLDGTAKTTCSTLDGQGVLPPTSVRSIGDALNAKNISWAYYGGGYYLALYDPALFSELYDPVSNPFRFQNSIMTSPAQRAAHIKDVINLYSDIQNSTLPAVSYVKPDTLTDGHPGTSKLDLFEAFVQQLVTAVQANPKLWATTAILVTFDEAGGYYDSGFIQPLDFFGDGPRTVMIAVSPYSAGGKIVHTYADHASVVKFIERNWGLTPLSSRSRDNFPNPVMIPNNPYVPANMPAIDDLFSMFNFVNVPGAVVRGAAGF